MLRLRRKSKVRKLKVHKRLFITLQTFQLYKLASCACQLKGRMAKEEKKASTEVKTKKNGAKDDLIKKYQTHKDDTGSTEVQIAILTKKVSDLTKHLKDHKKDFDSRRGLLMMVGKRRRLLNYLKKSDETKYAKLISDLGLKR